MARVDTKVLATCSVPYMDSRISIPSPITPSRGYAATVGRPGESIHRTAIFMACIGGETVPLGSKPDLHSPIKAARGQAAAIRCPAYGQYLSGIACIVDEALGAGGIPHLHCQITARGKASAIR